MSNRLPVVMQFARISHPGTRDPGERGRETRGQTERSALTVVEKGNLPLGKIVDVNKGLALGTRGCERGSSGQRAVWFGFRSTELRVSVVAPILPSFSIRVGTQEGDHHRRCDQHSYQSRIPSTASEAQREQCP